MSSYGDLHDDLVRKYGSTMVVETNLEPAEEPPAIDTEKAFVARGESGRTVITAPLREVAATNAGFTYLRGRLVGADTPNGNGALWTTADLELGRPSVAGGPLNWIHDDMKNIGCLIDGELVSGREAAASGIGNHIVSTAAVWRYLFPKETAVIEKAAADGKLFYSMECISREVQCLDKPGRPGCGETFSYVDADSGNCCTHIREKSSARRMIDPLFLGAAVIVPPVNPGWSQANVDVIRQAAQLSEEQGVSGDSLNTQQATDLVAAVLGWANRS